LSASDQKKAAGEYALKFIEDGMNVGLGTGSTAEHLVRALAASDMRVKCAATSVQTATLATSLGLRVYTLDELGRIDVTVDGADEIDRDLNLIKGGGGALMREKIVAHVSDMIVTIADGSKLVDRLGAFALPIEVVDFAPGVALTEIKRVVSDLGCASNEARIRADDMGEPFITDGGHLIIDCACEAIPDARALEMALNALPFVVENGIFTGLSSVAVLGTDDGVKEVRAR
jgi:ribose 5-phosphate isomerase A